MPEFFLTNFKQDKPDRQFIIRVLVQCLRPIYEEYSGVGFFFEDGVCTIMICNFTLGVQHANTGKSGSIETVNRFNHALSTIIPLGLADPIQVVEHKRVAFFPQQDVIFFSKPTYESFHRTKSFGGSSDAAIETEYKWLEVVDVEKVLLQVREEAAPAGGLGHQVINYRRCSEVTPEYRVRSDDWVLSLVRQVKHEHAFLILEGYDGDAAIIYFIDFRGDPKRSGKKPGKVVIDSHTSSASEFEPLLARSKIRMMDVSSRNDLVSKSWNVEAAYIPRLLAKVRHDKKQPPIFNILGRSSYLSWMTGTTKGTSTGHNCYTWAREVIHSMEASNIHLPEGWEWFFSATSRFLPGNADTPIGKYAASCTFFAVTGVAVATTAVVVANADTLSDSCKMQ